MFTYLNSPQINPFPLILISFSLANVVAVFIGVAICACVCVDDMLCYVMLCFVVCVACARVPVFACAWCT